MGGGGGGGESSKWSHNNVERDKRNGEKWTLCKNLLFIVGGIKGQNDFTASIITQWGER